MAKKGLITPLFDIHSLKTYYSYLKMIIKSYAKKLSNFIDINDIEWSTLINLSNGIMGFPVLSIAYTFQQVVFI